MDQLSAVLRRARFTYAAEHAFRRIVFNRLFDAEIKLGALRWLQTVIIPGIDMDRLIPLYLLPGMDVRMNQQDVIEDCVAQLPYPLIDERLLVVFYA